MGHSFAASLLLCYFVDPRSLCVGSHSHRPLQKHNRQPSAVVQSSTVCSSVNFNAIYSLRSDQLLLLIPASTLTTLLVTSDNFMALYQENSTLNMAESDAQILDSGHKVLSPREPPELIKCENAATESDGAEAPENFESDFEIVSDQRENDLDPMQTSVPASATARKRSADEISGLESSTEGTPSQQKTSTEGTATAGKQADGKPAKKPKITLPKDRDCIGCPDPHNIRAFPRLLPSSDCAATHGRDMCRTCMIAWINSQIERDIRPRCAICKARMDFDFVKSLFRKKWDTNIGKA
jgi:hypothetical protein